MSVLSGYFHWKRFKILWETRLTFFAKIPFLQAVRFTNSFYSSFRNLTVPRWIMCSKKSPYAALSRGLTILYRAVVSSIDTSPSVFLPVFVWVFLFFDLLVYESSACYVRSEMNEFNIFLRSLTVSWTCFRKGSSSAFLLVATATSFEFSLMYETLFSRSFWPVLSP